MSWEDRAACRDRPDLSWFPVAPMGRGPKSEHHDAVAAAIAVCQSCPVINECRVAGRTESGIWGGEYHTEEATRKALARTPGPIQHGTEAGAKAHIRRGEPACVICKRAASIAKKEREERRRALYGPRIHHGTPAGYRAHLGKNEAPCGPCEGAYQREQERAALAAEKRTQAHAMAKGLPDLVLELLEAIKDGLTPADQGNRETPVGRGEPQSADGEVAA